MAKNRGTGWGSLNIKMVSAEQLLMIIEYASFNSQTSIGKGFVESGTGTRNMSAFTGSTDILGNTSGLATSTKRLRDNSTLDTYTSTGYTSVRYRGVENPWSNIYKYVDGINQYGDGTMESGESYICDDFDFEESKNNGNYKPVGFTIPYDGGISYIKYFGYSNTHDWVFIVTKLGGNSSLPVGDSLYSASKINGYKQICNSGRWYTSPTALCGMFFNTYGTDVGFGDRTIGARLCYV
jgi:hypothetical protein